MREWVKTVSGTTELPFLVLYLNETNSIYCICVRYIHICMYICTGIETILLNKTSMNAKNREMYLKPAAS